MTVKIINRSHHPLPEYATVQSAGVDLRANLDEPVVMKPMERRLIPTGLFISLPAGFEAQVRPLVAGRDASLDLERVVGAHEPLQSAGASDHVHHVGLLGTAVAHRNDGLQRYVARTVGCEGA